jgi:putative membrane protein
MKTLNILILACATCFATAQTSTLSERDQTFMKEAMEGNLLEVRLGELAQTNASAPEVKRLGQMMITDHKKAADELKNLASQKNVSLPTGLSEKSQKHYDMLAKKQGKDFDKAFTKCMVMDHKKDICKFKKEAKKGDDPTVKTWASNTLPTLEHHKIMSKETCKAVKKSS